MIEPFYRKPLFEASITIIENLQGDDPASNPMMKAGEFLSHIGNSGAFIGVIVLVYNFSNIFKSFVLLTVVLFSAMLIGSLKMVYINPRPYWKSDQILPFGCEAGWGNPSGHSLASTAFYLTFWHIIFESSKMRHRKTEKYVSFCFFIFLIFMIMFSRMLVGMHSLNQVLFGFQIGFGVYFLIFYVLNVNVNSWKQLLGFIQIKTIWYVLYNVVCLIIVLLLYFLVDVPDEKKWNDIIEAKCPGIPDNKRMQKESLISFGIFLANATAWLGIKFEYLYTFNENFQNWRQYNFEMNDENDTDSLMTKISINKETQWNHTNLFYSCLRLVVIGVMSGILMIPYVAISWDTSLTVSFLFKTVLPIMATTFCLYYVFKIILKHFRLVNLTLYSMMQDTL